MKPNHNIKKPDSSSKLSLEEIIGLNTRNCNGLASNTSTAKCAYVAGCVLVVYDVDSSTQSHLMVSHRMPKPLCCLAMSRDGRYVAAGESGPQPAVLVWDCANLAFISELKGHLYGVECIAFSPDGEHLVTVGGYIYLWNWRSAMLVMKLKANSSCSAITSACFSSDAKFIVTAGKKHLKFWTIGSSATARTRLNKGTESLTLHAKPVNLGIQKESYFVSVISATWTDNGVVNQEQAGESFTIYALTDAGILYIVHSGLSVTKSVDLKVKNGFALSASSKLIACACSNGAVHLFDIQSLKHAGTLHYSEAKKCNGENDTVSTAKATELYFKLTPTIPNAIACQFSTSEKLVVVYGDHSLYVWDIHDVNEATRCCVLVSHSACIWDIKNLGCENMHDPSVSCVARGCTGGVSFSTCSADGTIRLWDLALQSELSKDVLGHESLNIEPMSTAHLVSAGIFERNTMETSVSTQGYRSMAVSSEGKYLAAGDFDGNLHIYDLKSSDYTYIEDAHDAEILSLSFSLSSKKDDVLEEVTDSHYFLASGGRDRTIHLYDVKRNFDLIESIDDHSAAVTAVKFTCNGRKILSCSADRSLVVRDVVETNSAYKISRRHQQLASQGTVYDMDIDPTMEVVITVGQDKKINSFSIAAGKLIRSFKQAKDFGDPMKVTVDPSGSYLVCSYSNKSICLYDFISGEMVAKAMGHGEVITGVTFLPDCKHIVSVGGDGCIFLWKVPAHLASRIVQRVKEKYGILPPRNFAQPAALSPIIFCEEEDQKCRMDSVNMSFKKDLDQIGPHLTSAFKFSISRLPKWAQKKVTDSEIVPGNLDFSLSQEVEKKSLSPFVGDVEGYSPESQEVQIPSNHDLEDSNSCTSCFSTSFSDAKKSQSSPLPQETISSFALGKRWLRVYTVCMDLLNSPEVLKKSEMQENIDVNTCLKNSEDSDLFKQHFGSLSATNMVKNRASAVGRRFSSQYVVHRDYGRGSKRLFDTPVQNSGLSSLNCAEKSGSHVKSENHTWPMIDSFGQDPKNLNQSLFSPDHALCQDDITKCLLKGNSMDIELAEATFPVRNEVLERITECKKALVNLEAAAKSVDQLFSKLDTQLSGEEISTGPGAQLYNKAAKLLPSIAEKVNAVAKQVRNRNNDVSERSGIEVSRFEPLLGTLAESLSQKVVEILKNNLSNA
ncbi:transducin/WD40 repeat-like superfamily protein [Citrus sinensis]|nr:transducin/WD40 repeat-like superfamily protein [Citrus sinensis]